MGDRTTEPREQSESRGLVLDPKGGISLDAGRYTSLSSEELMNIQAANAKKPAEEFDCPPVDTKEEPVTQEKKERLPGAEEAIEGVMLRIEEYKKAGDLTKKEALTLEHSLVDRIASSEALNRDFNNLKEVREWQKIPKDDPSYKEQAAELLKKLQSEEANNFGVYDHKFELLKHRLQKQLDIDTNTLNKLVDPFAKDLQAYEKEMSKAIEELESVNNPKKKVITESTKPSTETAETDSNSDQTVSSDVPESAPEPESEAVESSPKAESQPEKVETETSPEHGKVAAEAEEPEVNVPTQPVQDEESDNIVNEETHEQSKSSAEVEESTDKVVEGPAPEKEHDLSRGVGILRNVVSLGSRMHNDPKKHMDAIEVIRNAVAEGVEEELVKKYVDAVFADFAKAEKDISQIHWKNYNFLKFITHSGRDNFISGEIRKYYRKDAFGVDTDLRKLNDLIEEYAKELKQKYLLSVEKKQEEGAEQKEEKTEQVEEKKPTAVTPFRTS